MAMWLLLWRYHNLTSFHLFLDISIISNFLDYIFILEMTICLEVESIKSSIQIGGNC